MATPNLQAVTLLVNWKGAYNSALSYLVNDGVIFMPTGGAPGQYVCIAPTGPGVDPTNTANWLYIGPNASAVSGALPSVLCAATANIASLSGTTTLDGIAAGVGARVLLPFQSTASQGGVWVVQSGAWTRPPDFAANSLQFGLSVEVESGTAYGGTIWELTNTSPVTVDTTAQTWAAVRYVDLGSNQTIGGVKTFTSIPVFPAGTVTTAELVDSSVTSAKIADGTITSADIANLAIVTALLADSAVTSAKIADGTIATADIAALAISTGLLADGAVTSAKILDGTIATADIANLAITTALLADGSVTSTKILDGTIATADIANLAITTALLADGSVTSAKILDGTIATVDIANLAITTALLADSSVTSAKIADGTIVDADVSASAAIASSKISGSLPPSGSASGDLTGTYPGPTIASGAVTSAKILDGTIVDADINAAAAIQESKVANLGVDLAARLLKAGDTMSGILNMGGNKVTSVTDPSNPQDAMTLNYANAHYAATTGTKSYATRSFSSRTF